MYIHLYGLFRHSIASVKRDIDRGQEYPVLIGGKIISIEHRLTPFLSLVRLDKRVYQRLITGTRVKN